MNTFLVFFVIFVSAKVWSFVSVVTAARTHARARFVLSLALRLLSALSALNYTRRLSLIT